MKELKKSIENLLKNLPDWTKQKSIKLLADQELVFKWDPAEGLKIKINRCNFCAQCCLEVPEKYLPFGTNGEGKCNKLGDDGKCAAGHQKPFACLDDPPASAFKDLNCCIKYF